MTNSNHVEKSSVSDPNDPRTFVVGLLLGTLAGSLVGAGAMLLLAPQSGKRTRAQLQQRGVELRDQTSESVDHAVAQAGAQARRITGDVREKADNLQQRGQDVLDEQRGRLTKAVAAGKTAIQDARS